MEVEIIKDISYGKLNMAFPDYKDIDKKKLKLTTEGIFSFSGKVASAELCKYISSVFKTNNITITDGTSNNGSDTIAFCLNFKFVNAIELNKVNFQVLKNNIKTYNLKNVNLINDDCLKHIGTLKQEVLYFDPPWGGVNYKKEKNLKLYLGELEVSDIYNTYIKNCKVMIFKLPVNYDFNNFVQKTKIKDFVVKSFAVKDNIKFYYLICKNI
jgi:hypothetical protein